MALPTPDDLKTMDYAYQAQPFVDVAGSAAAELGTMDWAYLAQPFVRNVTTSAVASTNLVSKLTALRQSYKSLVSRLISLCYSSSFLPSSLTVRVVSSKLLVCRVSALRGVLPCRLSVLIVTSSSVVGKVYVWRWTAVTPQTSTYSPVSEESGVWSVVEAQTTDWTEVPVGAQTG